MVSIGIGRTGQTIGEDCRAGEARGRAGRTCCIGHVLKSTCIALADIIEQVSIGIASSTVTRDSTTLIAGIGTGLTRWGSCLEVADCTNTSKRASDDSMIIGQVATSAIC